MQYEIVILDNRNTVLDVAHRQIDSDQSDRDARKWAREVAKDSDARWWVELWVYPLRVAEGGAVLESSGEPVPVFVKGKPYVLRGKMKSHKGDV